MNTRGVFSFNDRRKEQTEEVNLWMNNNTKN